MNISRFKFHGNLTDFIRLNGKDSIISYSFSGHPSIKDAVEAIGVPHTEVKEVKANGQILQLSEILKDADFIEVFPFIQIENSPIKFILDVHLGKLARLLRLLGFDVLYENYYSDKEIVELIKKEQRIVLTRDIGLLKHKVIVWGYWLRSQDPFKQLEEVKERFQLEKNIQPFTRCLLCNGPLHKIEKVKLQQLLPPRTQLYYHEFYECQDCKKLYWKGSHYDRMLQQIQGFL